MTCRSRSLGSGVVAFSLLILLPAAAGAAELPAIKISATNQVAACATPGRLMGYLRQRNPKLDPRYETLASEYMRHGEDLHVRWEYAFFQMLLETGYLTYGGDVKPDQNNFAGLGATGGGARGERFKTISDGVRAHIEHLVMYSGERVENPVAERTRNIQEWGVLTSWQKSISGPITFGQMAKKWAPTSRRYASDISSIADRFFDGPCKEADPQPELVAEVRGAGVKTASLDVSEMPAKTRALGGEKRVATATDAADAVEQAPAGGAASDDSKFPIKGAAAVAAVAETAAARTETTAAPQQASTSPPLTVLNASASAATDAVPPEADAPAIDPSASVSKPAKTAASSSAGSAKAIEVAALPGALKEAGKVDQTEKAPKADKTPKADKSDKTDKPKKSEKAETPEKSEKKSAAGGGAAPGKCRVWTASYGGSKAIIIKAVQDKTVNYTVLDVNDGSEKREADAYINAYAKGGQSVGEFSSQSQALEKAFELCPEG
jgi:hypothetical protein